MHSKLDIGAVCCVKYLRLMKVRCIFVVFQGGCEILLVCLFLFCCESVG